MYNESEEKECFLENDPKVCNASVSEVQSEVLLEKYYAVFYDGNYYIDQILDFCDNQVKIKGGGPIRRVFGPTRKSSKTRGIHCLRPYHNIQSILAEKLTEYYWYDLKQYIPRVFDDFLIGPKTPYGSSSFLKSELNSFI